MKKIITLLFTITFLFAFDNKNYAGDICLKETPKIPSEAVFIDVRTQREYIFQHAKDSINIPIFFEKNGRRVLNESFLEEVIKVTDDDIDIPIVIICRSGKRSITASNILAEYGYDKVYNIEKGFVYGYKKTKLPVER
jgi:rhodanese-related sulfurtransferase